MSFVEMRGHAKSEALCTNCPVRNLGLCGAAGPDAARAFAAQARRVSIPPGAQILGQDDPSDSVGVVISGIVKVVALSDNGAEMILDLCGPGELAGEPFRLETALTWEAATEVVLCWIPRLQFETLLVEHVALAQGYMSGVTRQLDRQRRNAAAMRGRSSLQRLSGWLLEQGTLEPGARCRVALSRRDLASLLDMTAETLCRGFRQLDDMGAIRMLAPDLISTEDSERLQDISDGVRRLPKGGADKDRAFSSVAA